MRLRIIINALVVASFAVLLFLTAEIFQGKYLTREFLNLPTNTEQVSTKKALDPAKVYTVRIRSRYDLRGLNQVPLRKLKPEREVFKPNELRQLEISARESENKKQEYENKKREIEIRSLLVKRKKQEVDEKRQQWLEALNSETYDKAGQYKDAYLELLAMEQDMALKIEDFNILKQKFALGEDNLELANLRKKKQVFEYFKRHGVGWQVTEETPIIRSYSSDGILSYTQKVEEHDFMFDFLDASGILFDETLTHVAYTSSEKDDYIDTLCFSLRGKGRPLTLKLAHDYSDQIGFIKADVYLSSWALKWKILFAGLGFWALFFFWRASKPRRLARAQERKKEQERQEKKREEQQRKRKEQVEIEEQQTEVQREIERQRCELEAKQREEEETKEQELRHQQILEQRVKKWRLRVKLEPNYLDEPYRENYAKTKGREVLTSKRNEWFEEYEEVMADEELLFLLTGTAPEVLDWLEARNQIVFRAEQLEVNKPKMTPEEWREKQLRWERIKAEDEAAKLFAAGKSQEFLLELRNRQFQEIDQKENLEDWQKDELKQVWGNITQVRMEDKKNGEGKEPEII